MSHPRGLLSRLFDLCVGIFVAALLLHAAVALARSVLGWLLGGLAIAAVVGLGLVLIRVRRERW